MFAVKQSLSKDKVSGICFSFKPGRFVSIRFPAANTLNSNTVLHFNALIHRCKYSKYDQLKFLNWRSKNTIAV